MVSQYELRRSNIPLCKECGSKWWEPHTENAKDAIKESGHRVATMDERGGMIRDAKIKKIKPATQPSQE